MKKPIYLLLILLIIVTSGFSQTKEVHKPTLVQKAIYFDVSPPLRDMVQVPATKADNSWKDGIVKNNLYPYGSPKEGAYNPLTPASQIQTWFGKSITDTTIQNFDGVGNVGGYVPPDTDGDVGLNHYFQVVNCSYAIYNKSGVKLVGPNTNSSIWSGMPNNSNDGDAVVLYDEIADRWLFTQFSLPHYPNGPFFQMIAVSTSPDPTGSYNRYEFSFTSMGDYPKFGIWTDGYYMSINRFSAGSLNAQGTGAVAFNRTKMLAGDQSAEMVMFTTSGTNEPWAILPADCDGDFPPAGTPNYFAYLHDNIDRIGIYEFHVDWTNTANSTYTLVSQLPVESFAGTVPGIPQQGTTRTLDPISGRLMFRLPFRKFSDHWSLVGISTVNVGSNVAGLRWYELRNPGTSGGTWSIYQQGTYSPDSHSRWMGSIDIDANGNIAMGYSVSSATMYPSIRYCGRMNNDPLGQITIAEKGIINGGGSQTANTGGSTSRWGDYSAISCDPSSNGTFWYTTEYYSSTSQQSWKTRIGSFSFANVLSVDGTATPSTVCSGGTTQLDVNATGGSGTYTYSWTSIPPGFTSTLKNPVASPLVDTKYIALANDGTQTKADTVPVTAIQPAVANAPNDTVYCITVPMIVLIGQATSYSHVKWTTSGDGTFNNDTIVGCLYTPGANDRTNLGFTCTLTAYALAPCTEDSSDQIHVTLDPCNAVPGIMNEPFSVSINPNPAKDNVVIAVNGLVNREMNITISTIEGKSVFTDNFKNGNSYTRKLELSSFSKGVYLVTVKAGTQVKTERLVIQ